MYPQPLENEWEFQRAAVAELVASLKELQARSRQRMRMCRIFVGHCLGTVLIYSLELWGDEGRGLWNWALLSLFFVFFKVQLAGFLLQRRFYRRTSIAICNFEKWDESLPYSSAAEHHHDQALAALNDL